VVIANRGRIEFLKRANLFIFQFVLMRDDPLAALARRTVALGLAQRNDMLRIDVEEQRKLAQPCGLLATRTAREAIVLDELRVKV